MSLILEALRKSEAERRRGQAPDVLAEMPPPTPAAGPAWRWRAWLPALFAVLVVATAWLLLRQPRTPVATADAVSTPAQPSRQDRPALPAIERLRPPPVATRSPAGVTATPAPHAPSPTTADVAPPSSAGSPTDTRNQPAHGLATAPAPAATATMPGQRLATNDATTAAPPPPAPADAQPPAPARDAPASRAPLESFADLASSERQALPPLKLSMHMWNDDPARRFAILDGQRVGEGDRIGDAVVEAITRDGVILDWQGRRLKLPLP